MERLNDNEVKEVARMQELITKYENVIVSLFLMAKSGKDLNLLKTCNTDIDPEINFLWRWIKERKDKE